MSSKRKLREVLEKDGVVAVKSPPLEDFKSRIRQATIGGDIGRPGAEGWTKWRLEVIFSPVIL